jgi:hypothetical protein
MLPASAPDPKPLSWSGYAVGRNWHLDTVTRAQYTKGRSSVASLSEGLTMKRSRLLVSVLAALGLALLPSVALAASYSESVAGIETGLPLSTALCPNPNSVSSFDGIAGGTLTGGFQIAVCHSPLTSGGATILSGTFAISNGTTTVAGLFTSGVVSAPKTTVFGSLCIQKYVVTGSLSIGQFGGKLVHYGYWTGTCNVFFATISGSAQLTTL